MSMGHVCPRCEDLEQAITVNDEEMQRMAARVAELEAALEPFARLAAPLVDDRASTAIGLTDDDFRRARAALAPTPAPSTLP